MIENLLSEIKFTERESALLKHNNKEEKEILPFVTQYQPSVSTLKEVLMKNWNLIQKHPLLRQIFKEPPIISYKKGKSLKDMLELELELYFYLNTVNLSDKIIIIKNYNLL